MASARTEEARTWLAKNGHRFEAELLAADGLRATFGANGEPKWIVSVADLVTGDAEVIREWRTGRQPRPLVDARLLAAWPEQAVAAGGEVRAVDAGAGRFKFESAHFEIHSDMNLSLSVVRDLATVFEATRSLLIALPLGLHAGGETERYVVMLTASQEAYGQLGGPGGSGGYYDAQSRRMLVLLPNLGIEQKREKVALNYANNLFVLKHEVTHQLLSQWHGPLPYWLHEGLPEFVASLPYSRGRYTLRSPTGGLREYLMKWRKGPTDRSVRIIRPERLMAMQGNDWNRAVAGGSAYDLYNSAGLLTHYFVGQRKGAPIAGFLEALRRGDSWEAAEKAHLLGERTRGSLAAELVSFGRSIGVDVKLME